MRCTSFGGTFFLCFQYMRSHRPEQNRLRLSLGSVTATGFPQRAQRKLRRTGAPSGPARSSPVSSPCAFFRHRAEQYRWVHRSARKRFPHTGQTASRFTARPRAQGHAKKTAQKKLSFLYGKSALLRARYGLLHTGRNQSCRCYTPPSGSQTGAAWRRSLRRGSCSSRYPPPSWKNLSRNGRSPIFPMDAEIITGSAHPGQQAAGCMGKFSRRFRLDYITFRPPRVNWRPDLPPLSARAASAASSETGAQQKAPAYAGASPLARSVQVVSQDAGRACGDVTVFLQVSDRRRCFCLPVRLLRSSARSLRRSRPSCRAAARWWRPCRRPVQLSRRPRCRRSR